ncbi:hypothetical protein SDC9_120288 [bioreactor metagenome]|uniref:Uncharacterized protein n=1 Tax=bioreactor metagenome TaxID=1076179 RepID=A0A645C7F7_9ZZZZ
MLQVVADLRLIALVRLIAPTMAMFMALAVLAACQHLFLCRAQTAARNGRPFAGLQCQTALGFGQQILGAAEQRCAGRANLGTGRIVAILVAMPAQLALADLAGRRIVLVLGNAERAGGNAVAAADAGIRVVADHPGHRILDHRRHRAGRHAGRVGAMHARGLHEGEAVQLAVLRFHRAVAVHLD